MSQAELPATSLRATADMPTHAPALPAGPAASHQQRQERLARLFRQCGDSADDRYLLHLMTRYREVAPP